MPNLSVFSAITKATRRKQTLSPVDNRGGGWHSIFDTTPGSWQRDDTPIDSTEKIVAFSAVYACVSLIASDIAKLPIKLRKRTGSVWNDISDFAPQAGPLLRPNAFQTRQQFIESWIVSKLLHGNTFVLKERDQDGRIVGMYVLDPNRVRTLVAPDGSVYYALQEDDLSKLIADAPAVPASEIIHDRMTPLFHPLVGVSPIYACGASATQGNRIQTNSATFFGNMSRPSGMLTAPAQISDETATRLKQTFENNFRGSNVGRLFVGGDGLDYKPLTIAAADAQLIEQLKFTVEDVARAFKVPLHMLNAGQAPTLSNVESLAQSYYAQTLQVHIEAIEQCLDFGLELPRFMGTEFALEGLLRMDSQALFESLGKGVRGGWMSPNEAREKMNLPPVEGGESPFLQHQDYSLADLAKRSALANPFDPGAREERSVAAVGRVDKRAMAQALDELIEELPHGDPWRESLQVAKDHRWMRRSLGITSPAPQPATVDEAAVRSIVEAEIAKAVAPLVEKKVSDEVAKITVPRDGRDGTDGRDGRDGQDGEPGRDAANIDVLEAIDPAIPYARGTYASHRGGIVRAFRSTDPIKGNSDLERCGWHPVVRGVDDISLSFSDDARTLSIRMTRSDGKLIEKAVSIPVPIYRGAYKRGDTYGQGDCMTYGGSLWIAKRSTSTAPPSDSWTLCVKRGQDGKDGKDGMDATT